MSLKLCQVLAIEKGTKQRVNKEGGEILKTLQKSSEFVGRSKKYIPLDPEDKDVQPDENIPIRHDVETSIKDFTKLMADLWSVVLTKERGNQEAAASFSLGTFDFNNIPATTLVFMEKQLDDVAKFVESIPTLDPSRTWDYNQAQGFYESEEVTRNRTKKVYKSLTLAPATDKHPAQAQAYTEDEVVGHYKEKFYAAVMSPQEQKKIQERVHLAKQAIKQAREEANTTPVTQDNSLAKVLEYIFDGAGVHIR